MVTRASIDAPGQGLVFKASLQRRDFAVSLDFTVAPGEVVVMLGPNGAGKSTALGMIAGRTGIDEGLISLEGRVLDSRLGTENVGRGRPSFVPVHQRRVGVVFQDYLLFPHLTVLANVAFGRRAQGTAKKAALASARHWLDVVGLSDLADVRPDQLSGGQAQKAALARALAAEPHALLLDEPLAALDAGTRVELREELRRRLHEFSGPSIVVTHDLAEAAALADRIIVIDHGRVSAHGRLVEIMKQPQTDYLRRLIAAGPV